MKTLYNIFLLFLGLFIISIGINTIISSNMGASPWDSATFTTAKITNKTPGFWLFIYGIGLTLAIEIINYKSFKFSNILKDLITIFIGFILGFFVNLTNPIIVKIVPPIFGFGIIGIFIFAQGIIFCKRSTLPTDPINNFMLKLIKFQNLSIIKARFITDSIALIITIFLSIYYFGIQNIFNYYLGIGTIIFFILLPIFINFLDTKLFK